MVENKNVRIAGFVGTFACAFASGCQPAEGLMMAEPAQVTVKFDFDNLPLPDVPLPNDIATRPDPESATGKRLNASMLAPTAMEQTVRHLADTLDGWGVYQPITIPFTDLIDVRSVLAGHRDVDYRLDNDVVYLVNIDEDSEEYGRIHHLDVGNGNYPVALENRNKYGLYDPNGDSISLPYNDYDEDKNGNGKLDSGETDKNNNGKIDGNEDENGNGYLDPPEDRDADGYLDKPNFYPADVLEDMGLDVNPAPDDLAGRADALMTFYEYETNTLIVSPMEPLLGRTQYAVIVTKRIKDMDGDSIGSPFKYINHTGQTDDLAALPDVVSEHMPFIDMDDIAFAWPYTTQSIDEPWIAVREGIYGYGPQAHLADEFPAVIGGFLPAKEQEKFPGRNINILHHEDWDSLISLVAVDILGGDLNTEQTASLLDAHRYVDFHVMGWYESPQLWERHEKDADGNVLMDPQGRPIQRPLDLQSWPQDLDRNMVPARGEKVFFWYIIPRKEVSVRGEGKPAPTLLLGHGYGSNRIGESIGFAGFLAQFGIATLVVDNVSHGLDLPDSDLNLAKGILEPAGLRPVLEAINMHRAVDYDLDGHVDSGVDFWTSYLFHTRDMMRQSGLDYMQLIRIVRQFDGTNRWEHDIDGDGQNELAGDFDADGIIDVGGDAPFYAMGGSLGGIMSTILGGVEPAMDAIIPIAGGGRLTDVGVRSQQGGVPEAVLLRIMGPMYIVALHDDGTAELGVQSTVLNDIADHTFVNGAPDTDPNRPENDPKDRRVDWLPIANVGSLLPGDTMVLENLDIDEIGCAYLLPDTVDDNGLMATAKATLASNVGDRLRISFYRGPVLRPGAEECEIVDGAEPIRVIDESKFNVKYQGAEIPAGELRAVSEGMGLRRTNPELRRFLSIGQMVIDPADPGVHARNMDGGLVYPETNEETRTRALIVTTVGDMNVPASTGLTVGRAAGFIDFLNADTRYDEHPDYAGMPANEIVIRTHTAEAVDIFNRFTFNDDPTVGVHMDVENLSGDTDLWAGRLPRLDPPLRLVRDIPATGGWSGSVFTYAVPTGQHGFALPGEQTDVRLFECQDGGTGPQACKDQWRGNVFDVGWYMFHTLGRFANQPDVSPFLTDCNTKEQCNDLPPTPAFRDAADLP